MSDKIIQIKDGEDNAFPLSRTVQYLELDNTKMSSSTGSVQSSSYIRIVWDDDIIIVNYYVRLQNPNGRPTITINNFPNIATIVGAGSPTHMRTGTTNYITDSSSLTHQSGTTTASISMFNYIGDAPSGSGYLVLQGTVAGRVWNN